MNHRCNDRDDIVTRDVKVSSYACDGSVRVYDTFRPCRRSRSVKDDRGMVSRDYLRFRCSHNIRTSFESAPINYESLDIRKKWAAFIDLLKELGLPKIYRSAAMLDHVFDLRSLHSRIDWDCNRTGVETGEVGDREVETVVHGQGQWISGAYAGGHEFVRE